MFNSVQRLEAKCTTQPWGIDTQDDILCLYSVYNVQFILFGSHLGEKTNTFMWVYIHEEQNDLINCH